jgi:hypothetical protein
MCGFPNGERSAEKEVPQSVLTVRSANGMNPGARMGIGQLRLITTADIQLEHYSIKQPLDVV